MEILAIIPARGGSKGVKRKNLRSVGGKPLVAHTIEASLNSKYITKTIVSTEDQEIAEVSEKFGAQTISRPDELALDETKTAPVMLHALKELEAGGYDERKQDKSSAYKPDYVVLLQPTCPLRDAKYIDDAFDFFFEMEKIGFDSCFSGFECGKTHSLWKIGHCKKAHPLYDYRKRPRRQDEDQHYPLISENGAFYALSREKFLQYEDFIGHNPCVYLTKKVVDIDTEADLEVIEFELNNRNKDNRGRSGV